MAKRDAPRPSGGIETDRRVRDMSSSWNTSVPSRRTGSRAGPSSSARSTIRSSWTEYISGPSPSGGGARRRRTGSWVAEMRWLACGSSFDHSSAKSMNDCGWIGLSSGFSEKCSSSTAMTALSSRKKESTVKLKKKGTAPKLPQSVPSSAHSVGLGAEPVSSESQSVPCGRTWRSCMMPFQLSPVAQRKRVIIATPNRVKLASSVRKSLKRTL
mmetsp:Transcript_21262/g.50716  ORF Transcript_21262/g.50716 Transcript_21262/m.50716 type:complete len:213 (-) Transcript_21262:127-765(-)